MSKTRKVEITKENFNGIIFLMDMYGNPIKATVIEKAMLAEELGFYQVALDLYLVFWLWVESLPPKIKTIRYQFSLADLLEE